MEVEVVEMAAAAIDHLSLLLEADHQLKTGSPGLLLLNIKSKSLKNTRMVQFMRLPF